ncbi:hypothetical protein NFI96_005158, partial [Prochilodus magdalenae]
VRAAVKDGVETVEVTEGATVTLRTDLTVVNSNYMIVWRFGASNTRIAQLANKAAAPYYNGIFSDRLHLDTQTGSLTISNIRTNDSGPYNVQIISDMVSEKHFSVTVNDCTDKSSVNVHNILIGPAVVIVLLLALYLFIQKLQNEDVKAAVQDGVETVEGTEGATVTLRTDLTGIKSDETIRWMFGATDTRIAQLLSGNTFTDYDERFKNRLQLDTQTGSLTISNIRTSDSGPYKVLISSDKVINKHFNVTVYEADGWSPPSLILIREFSLYGWILNTVTEVPTSVWQPVPPSRRQYESIQAIAVLTQGVKLGFPGHRIIIINDVRAAGKDGVETVEVTEGVNVTLRTNLTGIASDDTVRWTFGTPETRIAQLVNGNIVKYYNETLFKNRLQLDTQTGSLNISNIRTNDSGTYKIQISGDQVKNIQYDVTVYAKLRTPNITYTLQNQSDTKTPSSSRCSAVCTVRNGYKVTLSWFRGSYPLSSTNDTDNSTLSLRLDVKPCDNNTYSCVTANPIANQTAQLNTACKPLCPSKVKESSKKMYWLLLLLLAPVVIYVLYRKFYKNKKAGLLCVAGEEVIRLQELEGNTVTIHTGRTGVQSDALILWFYRSENVDIKIVNSQSITNYNRDRFRDRLQLDRTSGSLTIRNTSREDSGVYKLQIITEGLSVWSFSVDVYAPASKPIIRNQAGRRSVSHRESCSPLCSVENGKDVNLSWYEGERRISSIASTDSSERLYLPLNITHLNCPTYTCVAANPVSNQTAQLSITELCPNTVYQYAELNYTKVKSTSQYSEEAHTFQDDGNLTTSNTFNKKVKKEDSGSGSGLLCVAGEEVIRLQELEENPVTIHTGGTGVQSDAQILWFYGPENIRIVNSQIIRGEIITDYNRDRFRDRLQLDRTSGSLTIRNISREDSGVYKLQIITGKSSFWSFSVDVYGLLCVAGEEVIRLQELEGNTVTIHTGRTGVQSDAYILWMYRSEDVDKRIVNSHISRGEIITDYYRDRFRDRLQLDRTSGSLTIRNISREDSGVYKLHIITGSVSVWSFSVYVYAPVSKPIIRYQTGSRSVSHRESCSPLCSVENGKDVNLSWYEGEERISSITSTDSSERLYLPLNITHLNSPYTCVAANPVSNQTVQLYITDLCPNDTAVYQKAELNYPELKSTSQYSEEAYTILTGFRTDDPLILGHSHYQRATGPHGLLCVAGKEGIRLQELEGNTVTIHTGRTGVQSDALILWFYRPEDVDIKIVDSQIIRGEIITDYNRDRFRDRLQLDRTSGSLTIRNISREDSGVYKLQTITGSVSFWSFSVDVYAPVSKPIMRNQAGRGSVNNKESCSPLCSVENGKDVNLSWYEGEERISSIASTDSSERLYLPLNITHLTCSTYICVAANPVSNQTTQLSINELCPNTVPKDEINYAEVKTKHQNSLEANEGNGAGVTDVRDQSDSVVYSVVRT